MCVCAFTVVGTTTILSRRIVSTWRRPYSYARATGPCKNSGAREGSATQRHYGQVAAGGTADEAAANRRRGASRGAATDESGGGTEGGSG